MRNVYLLCAAALALTSGYAAAADRVVESDIELSEFTPVRQLRLNVDTGEYSVDAPDVSWPQGFPKPPKRSGKMPMDRLRAVQAAFAEASASTLSDQQCVAAEGRGFPIYDYFDVPRMSIRRRKKSNNGSVVDMLDATSPTIVHAAGKRFLHFQH